MKLKLVQSNLLERMGLRPKIPQQNRKDGTRKPLRKGGEMNRPQATSDRKVDNAQATKSCTFRLPNELKRMGIGRCTIKRMRRDQLIGKQWTRQKINAG